MCHTDIDEALGGQKAHKMLEEWLTYIISTYV